MYSKEYYIFENNNSIHYEKLYQAEKLLDYKE